MPRTNDNRPQARAAAHHMGSGSLAVRTVGTMATVCALGAAPWAFAQSDGSGGSTNLGSLGDNNLQQFTGDAVQTLCPKMAAIQDRLNPQQFALFERCRELVQTGFDINENGPNAFSLGLSEEELQDALQRVGPEETESLGAGLTETAQDQMASIASRLQYLRTGTSTLPIAGVHFSGEDWVGGAAGDSDFSRLGAFITGVYGNGDRQDKNPSNGVENALDFDAYGINAGIDYRFGDGLVLGVAVGYVDSEVEFGRNYGETETEGWNYMLYGTWFAENLFFEGSLVYGDYDYDMLRNVNYENKNTGEDIDQRITSETEGDSLAWTLGVGYNLNIENSNITFSAQARGIDADIDAYAESGGELAMAIQKQDIESLQSVIGVQAAFNFNRDFGVLVPYGSINWHHEFEDDARNIFARYVFDPFEDPEVLAFTTEAADEDFFRLTLGVNFVFTRGTQLFFNYETLLGLDSIDSEAYTIGLRLSL